MDLSQVLSDLSSGYLADVYLLTDGKMIPIGLYGNNGKGTYLQIQEEHLNTGFFFLKEGRLFKRFLSIGNTVVEKDCEGFLSTIAQVNLFQGLLPSFFRKEGEDFLLPQDKILLYDIPFRLDALLDVPEIVEKEDIFEFRLFEEDKVPCLEYDCRYFHEGKMEKEIHLLFRFRSFGEALVLPDIRPLSGEEDPLFEKAMLWLGKEDRKGMEYLLDMEGDGDPVESAFVLPSHPEKLLSSLFFIKKEEDQASSYVFVPSRYGNRLPFSLFGKEKRGDIENLLILISKEDICFLVELIGESMKKRHVLRIPFEEGKNPL